MANAKCSDFRHSPIWASAALSVLLGLGSACGSAAIATGTPSAEVPTLAPTTPPAEATTETALYPDVIDAKLTRSGEDIFSVSATIASPYDTPERYADAWRVLGPDGSVFGVRELGHDHQNEQPFTRSLANVEIPPDITSVTIEGRDQLSGWGGATFTVEVPN